MDLTVTRAVAHLVPYPLRRPFVASHQEVSVRNVIVVRLDTDAGTGWAECPVLPAAGYSGETTEGEFGALVRSVLPALLAGGPVSPESWAQGVAAPGHAPARAAVEAALLDAQCKALNMSLASRVGAGHHRVAAGAAVGLGSVPEVTAEVNTLLGDGYQRIKVKIAPGADAKVLAAVRDVAGASFDLQADANGAYAPADAERVRALDSLGLTCLEQPFSSRDLASHAALSSMMSTPICLDESITDEHAVRAAVEARACRIVSLKWSRLGGVLETARLAGECARLGVGVTIGGMLSSGLGRAVDLALAGLPAVTVSGDQSGSARYADFDLTEMIHVDDGWLRVPSEPGIGLQVDTARIEATATDTVQIVATGGAAG